MVIARRLLIWLGLTLWVLAPVAGVVLLGALDGRASFVVTEPVSAPVRAHDQPVTRVVDLGLQWTDGVAVPAPDWSGVVQQVAVSEGEEITSGAPVGTVDGITRLAWAAPGAFARPLAAGDRGEDVAWLNDLLAQRELWHTPGDLVTARTVRGIDALGRGLGVARPDGVFDPTWIVYLPRSPLVVAQVGLVVGHPAPSAGEPVLTAADVLARAVLATRGTYASAQSTEAEVSPALAAATGERLLVAGSSFPLDAERREVAPEALADLGAKLVPGAAGVIAQLVREPGEDELEVPSAAVFAGTSGGLCVRVRVPGEAGGRVVPVQAVGSEDGTTVVSGELAVTDMVVVPGAPGGDRCP